MVRKSETDIIDEEKSRLKGYFNTSMIRSAEDPIKEVMAQARRRRGFGLWKTIGKDPKAARQLFDLPKTVRRWSRRDIGKVKSVRTRGASLQKLAATLGRSIGSVYSLISRLKKKGEIK